MSFLLRHANFRNRPGTAMFVWPTVNFMFWFAVAAVRVELGTVAAVALVAVLVMEELAVLRLRRRGSSTE
jgi:hypothetical protein